MYISYITIQLEITIIYILTDEVCGIYFFLSDCTTKKYSKIIANSTITARHTTPVGGPNPVEATMTCKNLDICL